MSARPRPVLTSSLSAQRGGFFGKLFFLCLVIGTTALAVYAYSLDGEVVKKFENRKWDIPARVYSRPLILEQGANVSGKDLENWLKLLGYAKSGDSPFQAGTYQVKKNVYTIHTRGFHYGNDHNQQPQQIRIKIGGEKIASVIAEDGNAHARLEPVQIGSIYPDSNEDRLLITQDEILSTVKALGEPERLENHPLIKALIATEDRGFYEHYGVSIRGTGRAVLNNLRGGSMQGGSTLTQQLIKNFYLTSERSLKRKANEAIMALLLERHYTKDEILMVYLNEINLGQNGNQSINGFGIASKFYFNKPLNELRLDQYALLVGLAKGASYYNPRKHPERALERRNVVLHNMLVTGKIGQDDYDTATQMPLDVVATPSIAKTNFPDFLDYTRRELATRYRSEDLKSAGLRIITTLDPLVQISADKALKNSLKNLKNKKLQGALISANPHTGEVLALVGSRSDFTGFNRAIDSKRQVGSLLKPIIYLMALQSGEYNLASYVDDSPKPYKSGGKTWTPKNYGGMSYGDVPLTTALANSYNQSAVNVGMEIGLNHFVNYLKQLGIQDKIPEYPSVLLGAVDLSPMQMLGVYQIFATGGTRYPLYSIDTVITQDNRIIDQRDNEYTKSTRLPADVAFVTNYAMQKVISEGTAKKALSLGENLNLAGKTGTTNDARDAWFAGYSGNYVSIVWVGRDDNKPIGLTGGSGALPIWIDFMRRLHLTPVKLPEPENVHWRWLEQGTGRLSSEGCAGAVYVPVLEQSVPEGDDRCTAEHKEAERQKALAETFAEATASFDDLESNDENTPADAGDNSSEQRPESPSESKSESKSENKSEAREKTTDDDTDVSGNEFSE